MKSDPKNDLKNNSIMTVKLANPRGFCAGVDRAIEIVERALTVFGAPIYVKHEVVHNKVVVAQLRNKGAVFVEELAQVPPDATVIFSAHGVSQAVRNEAKRRNLNVFDATCPLVTKVHIEVQKYRAQGCEILLIGHSGHPEVEGTMGQVTTGIHLIETLDDVAKVQVINPNKLSFVSQTTLSMDDTAKILTALRARFPAIQGPHKDDICYATQHRQNAVKELVKQCDVIFVVGSPNSSNSNRLTEIAKLRKVPAYLIDGPEDIESKWLLGKTSPGITAGASAPEVLVQKVVDFLAGTGGKVIELDGPKETITFSLPLALRTR